MNPHRRREHAGGRVRIGVLAPLSRPGWVDAGRHLLAGLALGTDDANQAGGVVGRPIELVVRDTAADPARAVAAVDELLTAGVAALAGEYHSVVARAVARRAEELGIPFLCSSAVVDRLTDRPADWVARIAPPQSRSWSAYADYLLAEGHRRVAVAMESSIYWTSGARILRNHLEPGGGEVLELDMRGPAPRTISDQLADSGASALLLLTGYPEPAASIVRSIRRDPRTAKILVGAPAGQPELGLWLTELGLEGTGIPFLRYVRNDLPALGKRVEAILEARFGGAPSFVAFEGYDTATVLAELLRHPDFARRTGSEHWSDLSVPGTRGQISFARVPGVDVWQWENPPIQIVDRDPNPPHRFRVLRSDGSGVTEHSPSDE